MRNNERRFSLFILLIVIFFIIIYSLSHQFILPTFIEADEYYHLAVTRFIKDFWPRYNFHWAQFSTFKKFYSDKDFLFHLSIIPFLSVLKDHIVSGRCAIVFYNILFIITFVFILKKYLPNFLVACCLILPFLNFIFC